jgi:hypothetical protein
MIPEAFLTDWGPKTPWPLPIQIEQDLILSRLVVEIAKELHGDVSRRVASTASKTAAVFDSAYARRGSWGRNRTSGSPNTTGLCRCALELSDTILAPPPSASASWSPSVRAKWPG